MINETMDEVLIETLVEVLLGVRRGDCWCETGIGNPMMQGRHTKACKRAQTIVAKYEKRAAE